MVRLGCIELIMPRKARASREDAFLQTILENPDDDTPRLVFADWLEEQGDPRGAFIRLQCQRATMTQYDPGWKEILAQEAALLRQYEPEWAGPVLRLVDEVQFRRGFVGHVRVSATKLLSNAGRLFRVAPVNSVRMTRADRLSEMAASSWLARIRELDLSQNVLGSGSLQSLLNSEHCRTLRLLRLDRCELSRSSLQSVASAAALPELRSLSLAGNALGPAVVLLAASGKLMNLQDLDLHGNRLADAGAAEFIASMPFRLTRLSLGDNGLFTETLRALAGAPTLSELRHLDLQNNQINNVGLGYLLDSPHLARLVSLNLDRNHISVRGIQRLSESSLLANLVYLNLRNNEIDRPTLQTLPNRLQTPTMRELLF